MKLIISNDELKKLGLTDKVFKKIKKNEGDDTSDWRLDNVGDLLYAIENYTNEIDTYDEMIIDADVEIVR